MVTRMELVAVGADGARCGWAVAALRADGATRLSLLADVGEIARLRGGATVAIDVPIGLPSSAGSRRCDEQARERLGRRASCVFNPPARYLLAAAGDYGAIRALVARERARDPAAKGLSAQAAGIARKVAEVDAFVLAHPASEAWLFECHPEVSFLECNGGTALAGKRSTAGVEHRLDLVRRAFPDAEAQLAAVTWPRKVVELSDLLDAYAALATAVRCARGEHTTLGDGERDEAGVIMRIAV
jgi:predicted RNase H-like nuclease